MLAMLLIGLASLAQISGCATPTVFTPYTKRITPLVEDLKTGRQIDLSQCLLQESQGKDAILYAMERGRLAQIRGEIEQSIRNFGDSMEAISLNDEKAIISASQVGNQAQAIIVNDNVIAYEGERYERVMLHHFQALNYLAKRDLEGARVEIRRANEEQEESLKRHERDLNMLRNDVAEREIEFNEGYAEIDARFPLMNEEDGKVMNSFQNAYSYYLSGFVYELQNKPDEAYIDYRRALEIYPDNVFLRQDVARLAAVVEYGRDLLESRRYSRSKRTAADKASESAHVGELLVLFEEGFVPRKEEVKIPFPVAKGGVAAVAFPVYREKRASPLPLTIAMDSKVIAVTEPICDVRALAVNALKEKVPAMVVRQTVRLGAKGTVTKMAGKKYGGWTSLGMSIWNVFSERADLRSWQTLPANAQLLRVTLPAGIHRLSLKHDAADAVVEIDVGIKGNGKTILHVVRAGQRFYCREMRF